MEYLPAIVSEPIRCEKTEKLLAKRNRAGLFLHCDRCHKEHFVSWVELGVHPILNESYKEKEH